jgi:TRAP-type C4-dicarboxylate transport system permease large subunit
MFIGDQIAESTIGDFSRTLVVFIPVLLALLVLITYVPAVSLWLSRPLMSG